MKRDLALEILGKVMRWDGDQSQREFSYLSLLSRIKYDGYRGYVAGARFLESLAYWLQQFDPGDRAVAYDFLKNHLIYIGPEELQHLVELTYPQHIQRPLASEICDRLKVPRHLIWADPVATEAYRALLRRTLFLGLSDGARIDAFRRANEGIISNEQVATTLEIDALRWTTLLAKLRKDTRDEAALFEFVYLIDDFVGSGKTLLRQNADGAWDGKLERFWTVQKERAAALAPNYTLIVHHHIASFLAAKNAPDIEARAREAHDRWMPSVRFSYGLILPQAAHHDASTVGDFSRLIANHYSPAIETDSMKVGGEKAHYGFSKTGLCLVLEHNTPNNSIALLWAEADKSPPARQMRPLFRRRQRHFGV
jgi:hypothetical protein